MNFYTRLILAFVVVLALAEFIPEIVNSVLVLILIGMLLIRFPTFQRLAAGIGAAAK